MSNDIVLSKELVDLKIERVNIIVYHALKMAGENLDMALHLVDIAFADVDNAGWIKQCVLETVMHWRDKALPTEQNVYEWFRRNFKSYLGKNAEIIKCKNDPKNKPDFWVVSSEGTMPVECKLGAFDKKALNQLQRYMGFYNCDKGVAVAVDFTCDIPENIKTIKFKAADLRELG